MRIDHIAIKNMPPLDDFEITMSSNVIIIAGSNGCGKTRLKEALVQTFRKPNRPQASITLKATRQEEEAAWGGSTLAITAGQSSSELTTYLQTRTSGRMYTGALVQIESDRAVQPVKFEPLSLSTPDPDDAEFTHTLYLSPFSGRWSTLVNNIYRKSANRDQQISGYVKEHPDQIGDAALRRYPDTFAPYQQIFEKLLPGKTLQPIDPKAPKEFHYKVAGGTVLPFSMLSSGEKEVVKVAFDLVWKRITHSVILVDEPELHLHPTLTFRLIETMKEIGKGTNQLVLFTHSADLISTYYTSGNVFFIGDRSSGNQAKKLSNLRDGHETVARAAAANLGLFAVGKKIVFIEGTEASVDRTVYHRIAQASFPEAYLMPIGSVENLVALRAAVDEISQAVFGLEFFMVRDRDGLSDGVVQALEKNSRFRCLPRRHVENYLLDAETLAEVAKTFYLDSQLHHSAYLEGKLKDIASGSVMAGVLWNVRENLRVSSAIPQPKIRNVESLSISRLATELAKELAPSREHIRQQLTEESLLRDVEVAHQDFQESLETGTWQRILPGKLVFNRFCGEVLGVAAERVRQAYVEIAMERRCQVFSEPMEIFDHFSKVSQVQD